MKRAVKNKNSIVSASKKIGIKRNLDDLSNSLIMDIDLSGISLAFANLSGTKFARCNLSGAKFKYSICNKTSFVDCELDGTEWNGAIIVNSNINGERITSRLVSGNSYQNGYKKDACL